jgi:hypothetical protein
MLLRCVLSAVCVALLAPIVPARAKALDDPSSGAKLHGTSARIAEERQCRTSARRR